MSKEEKVVSVDPFLNSILFEGRMPLRRKNKNSNLVKIINSEIFTISQHDVELPSSALEIFEDTKLKLYLKSVRDKLYYVGLDWGNNSYVEKNATQKMETPPLESLDQAKRVYNEWRDALVNKRYRATISVSLDLDF